MTESKEKGEGSERNKETKAAENAEGIKCKKQQQEQQRECVWCWERELVTDKRKKINCVLCQGRGGIRSISLKGFQRQVADGSSANARQ